MRTRFVVATLITGAAMGFAAPRAEAGGLDTMSPVKDRYEVGDTATVIGYASQNGPGDLNIADWADTGPFTAYLRADLTADGDPSSAPFPVLYPTDIPLGNPDVDGAGYPSPPWAPLRVSLSFVVPDVGPGTYEIVFCNEPCTTPLGYIADVHVSIGVDPDIPYVREWPVDEPAIAELAPDALLIPPGYAYRLAAAQVRGDVIVHEPEGGNERASRRSITKAPTAETCSAACAEETTSDDTSAAVALLLVGVGALAVLWALALRAGAPRKRVTSMSATSTPTDSDLPCDPPTPIRL